MSDGGPGERPAFWAALVTIFPELLNAFTEVGVLAQAVRRGKLVAHAINPRDFATDRHGTVDDEPYGGGPGMVMKVEPLAAALARARAMALQATGQAPRVLYLSPQGRRFDQAYAEALARDPVPLVLLAGRYEAVDERVLETLVDEEVSMGDFVVTGGELPALLLLDAVCRLLPGILGNRDSLAAESFDGALDHSHYTRPQQGALGSVPAILMSGDHAAIARYRRLERLRRTYLRRPDLLSRRRLGPEELELLRALMSGEAGAID